MSLSFKSSSSPVPLRASKNRQLTRIISIIAISSAVSSQGMAQDATYVVKQLTPETAIKAAQAALGACRKQGFQVAVAVVDRAGIPQALLRDRFAGPHTVDVAINKAWTATSFRMDTLSFSKATSDPENAGARHIDRVIALGGGVPVEAAGSMFGAIGVSGGPSGSDDDKCARSGIEAIQESLEF
jgi:uncharacterized protein GlcG (DUF336 family)